MKTKIQIEITWNEGFEPSEDSVITAKEKFFLEDQRGFEVDGASVEVYEWNEDDDANTTYILLGEDAVNAFNDDDYNRLCILLNDNPNLLITWDKRSSISALMEELDGYFAFQEIFKEDYEFIKNY